MEVASGNQLIGHSVNFSAKQHDSKCGKELESHQRTISRCRFDQGVALRMITFTLKGHLVLIIVLKAHEI